LEEPKAVLKLPSEIKDTQDNKFKVVAIETFSAVLLGGILGHHIDNYFEKTRYPIAVEYTIINNCISSYQKPMKGSHYQKKTEMCICALSKTMEDFDYSDYKKDKKNDRTSFFHIFEKKVEECP